jgi:hypothetical protein
MSDHDERRQRWCTTTYGPPDNDRRASAHGIAIPAMREEAAVWKARVEELEGAIRDMLEAGQVSETQVVCPPAFLRPLRRMRRLLDPRTPDREPKP